MMSSLTRFEHPCRTLSSTTMAALLFAIAAQTNPSPLRIGQTFLAAATDPAEGSAGWALVSHGVGEKMFTVNSKDEVVPQLAKSANRTAANSWVVTLKSGRFFSDGSPVTAADVATSLGRTNQENNAAQSSCGIMTFTVQGELTLTITTTIPTPIMHSVLAEWAFVVYKSLSTGMVFTGPYAIESLGPDELNAVANKYYPGYSACQRLPLVIKKYSSGPAVTNALSSGEIHLGFNLPSGSASQLNWLEDVTAKSFSVGYQYMMFFNTARATLSDVNVRKALALAVDRHALSQATHPAGMPATTVAEAVATGPFPANTPWGSAHPRLTTNATQAAEMLEAAGWNLNNDGIRVKSGVQLRVDLVYYTFRSDLVAMAPLIKEQLEAVGANVTVRVDDSGNYMEGAGFDLLLWAQNTLPAGDPNWFLETFFYSQAAPILGSWTAQNFASYNSANIDGALDALRSAEGAARATAASDAHTIILNEAPATFLTSPTWHVGVRGRLSSYTPWGSDYYVVKSDMPDESATCSYSGVSQLGADKDDDDKIGLYVAIGVLSGVSAIALATAFIAHIVMQKTAPTAATSKSVDVISKTADVESVSSA